MKFQSVPLTGGFYADDTRPWSSQDCANWLPSQAEAEGTRTPLMLKTPPGLLPYVAFSAQPVRGTYNCEGSLFAVIGSSLLQISNTGVMTTIGTVPGTGMVVFSDNQIPNGNELIVVNGSSGYVYNTATKVFSRITDPGYPGAINVVFLGGYLVQIEPARRFAFNSAPADALSYNTLDRFTSEVSPDLLVSQAVNNNELILFSQKTSEFFEVTANANQPLRTKGISMSRGCGGRYTVANMDNTVYWLGDDGIFYRLAGYSPQRVSTRPIEQAIVGLDWDSAFAFVWQSAGYKVCYWTFPDGHTWGFDVSSGIWHRRESYTFNRWRVSSMTYWNDIWIAGDFQTGRLWEVAWDYVLEGTVEFISSRTTGVLSNNQNRVIVPRLELIMATGQKESVLPPPRFPPTITGSLGDGRSESSVHFQYTLANGVPPYGPVTVSSGALPDGLSISAGGMVTGTRTTEGDYSWVLHMVDTDGTPAFHADTSTTIAPWEWTFIEGQHQTEEISRIATPALDLIDDVIVCCSDQHVYTSTDAYNWTQHASLTMDQMYSVGATKGPGMIPTAYMAFSASGGGAQRSTDGGVTWATLTSAPNPTINCVVSASHCILAMIDDMAFYSTDGGDTWAASTIPSGFNPGDSSLPFAGLYIPAWEQWVFPGQGSIYTSHGVLPSLIELSVGSLDRVCSVAYSPILDMVVVTGNSTYTRGRTGSWTNVVLPVSFRSVCWVPSLGQFMLFNTGGVARDIYVSPDGVNWTVHVSNLPSIIGTGTATFIPWIEEIMVMIGNANNSPWVSDI